MDNKREIKFIAQAVKWFDKVNGNTYHSVNITRTDTGEVVYCAWTYGYGDHYRQTALIAMAGAGWLGEKYSQGTDWYSFERENNYPILWNVRDGLKRDMVANGRAQ